MEPRVVPMVDRKRDMPFPASLTQYFFESLQNPLSLWL